jgi:UPF0755 protein
MSLIIKLLKFTLFFSFLLAVWLFFSILQSERATVYPVEFEITAGMDVRDIARMLESRGVIANQWSFLLYSWLTGEFRGIQVREYELKSSMRLIDVLRMLNEPQWRNDWSEVTVTLTEGMTAEDMAEYLWGIFSTFPDPLPSHTFTGDPERFNREFMKMVSMGDSLTNQYSFLSTLPKGASLEGYLFPDTYKFYQNSSSVQIVERMLNNFNIRLSTDLRSEIEKQGKSLHEFLTLASILEKEVQTYEDKQLVADIFYRRMLENMPLQADSTVNYATKKARPSISLEDSLVDSPYNTYKYRGLPPGPICNPGLNSIRAALYPKSNAYWYFLTSEIPDGSEMDSGTPIVVYSETFEEHVMNKNKYL